MLKIKIILGQTGTLFRFGRKDDPSFFDVKFLNEAAHLWRLRTQRAVLECKAARSALKIARSPFQKWYYRSELIVQHSIFKACKTMYRLTGDRARVATHDYLTHSDGKSYFTNYKS